MSQSENEALLNEDIESCKIKKDFVIHVVNESLDNYQFRTRIRPSVKHDELVMFNVDKAMRMRREAIDASIGNVVVSDDIRLTLSLLNSKGGPQKHN